MTKINSTGRSTMPRRLGTGLTLALAMSATACQEANNQFLNVVDPDIINPADVVSPEAAVAVANGAIATFRTTTGAGESTWLFGGLLADEWSTSSTFIQNDETDQRQIQEFNGSVTNMLRNLYRVRTRADQGIAALQAARPDARALIAEMYLARGYTEMQLASDFCNGVPIGNGNATPPEDGTPKSNQELFAIAAASLDSGLTFANGTDAASVLMNRALRVTRGRVALGRGDFAGAGTLVTGVPTSFLYQHTFSANAGTNTIWGQGISSRRYSVGDSLEGNARILLARNAIPFASARDPRLPVTIPTSGAVNGQDGQTYTRTTTMWGQFTAVDVVNGIDARMIEAESALKAGNTTQWLAIHNALRAAPPKLAEIQPTAMAALVDPGTEAGRVSLHFREKAFWTFSRGQRLGDMRRLVRQYGRTVANVFPQGAHFKGGDYGGDVNLPVVTDERNNPNFKGCTDRLP
ncbi:hypothetical protein [Gemmatimonas sp.]|uniref:hypothetical protein n=1 Tax=Gemmatimonas sp. TaxID=1962908 RepID=UPI003566B284